jgi:hypothetical protein
VGEVPADLEARQQRLTKTPKRGEVVRLDPRDDLGSVRVRLEQTTRSPVYLVVPPGLPCLRTELGIRLLHRQARALGREVIIVSRDPTIRELAHENGFRVRRSLLSEDGPADASTPLPQLALAVARKLAGDLVGVLQFELPRWWLLISIGLLGAIFLLLYLPQARVVVTPRGQPVEATVSVTARRGATAVDPAKAVIPARVITAETDLTQTVRIAAGQPIAAQDRDRARTAVLDRAREQAMALLWQVKAPSDQIFPQTVRVNLASEDFDRRLGEQAPTLTLKARVRVEALAFDAQQANQVVRAALARQVPAGQQLGDQIETRPGGLVSADEDSVVFEMFARGVAFDRVDPERVRSMVRGRSVGDATRLISENFELAEGPVVEVYGSPLGRLPAMGNRIGVEIRQPALPPAPR